VKGKNGFVLDCSLTMAWCFEDERSENTDRVLAAIKDCPAFVPALWPVEVCNVLAYAERRGRISGVEVLQFFALLSRLPITIEPPLHAAQMPQLYSLTTSRQLSAYDASYLEVAMRRGLPIGSCDAKLVASAKQVGVDSMLAHA
jgi:predicted nucleic acid-binding protein